MNPMVVLKWAIFAYVLFQGARYLMMVRVYLVYAFRDVRVTPTIPQQIDPGLLELLTSLDDSLAAAGFRHLGFGQTTPLLTYSDRPLPFSVWVNDAIPAYAFVAPHALPAYSALVEVNLRTAMDSGIELATFNVPAMKAFLPPDMQVEALPGSTVAALVESHQRRIVAAKDRSTPARHADLEDAIDRQRTSLNGLRALFRGRRWMVPTADASLDRFTLPGAVALARDSLRVIGAVGKAANMPTSIPTPLQRRLRIEADLRTVTSASDNPQPIPGIPWPLILVVMATAVVSWIAMGVLWSFYVATVLLAAIAFHEAGHAVAMRSLGYRDVQVFFVPLLGALTVGRPVTTSVRDRMLILLAGPVPGLWLGLILGAVAMVYGPTPLLRVATLALLILNGLNLLPFTPLDGGRALELLTRPDSFWQIGIRMVSAAALLALGLSVHDPLLSGIGAVLLVFFPQQWRTWQLRRAVAAATTNPANFREVARITLELMDTNPRYAAWKAGPRQAMARTFARSFADPAATATDRVWGAIAYVSAWIPVGAWFLLSSPVS